MPYRLEILPHAGRQMRRLPEAVRRRVDQAIRGLLNEPRPHGCFKLQAEENAWRIRVGDYRIIYEIHDEVLLVLVIRVDHRRNVYR
jgi:mRNA interferase RelE/StbE